MRWATISILLATAGCVYEPSAGSTLQPTRRNLPYARSVPDDYELHPSRDVGLIMITTRFAWDIEHPWIGNCIGSSSISVEVLEASSREYVGGLLLSSLVEPDFTIKLGPPGYVTIWELKAGSYMLGDMVKERRDGGHWHTGRDLGFTFSVTPGEVHYLGELFVTELNCSQVGIRVSDQEERDRWIFDQRMNKLASKEWKRALLQPHDAGGQ